MKAHLFQRAIGKRDCHKPPFTKSQLHDCQETVIEELREVVYAIAVRQHYMRFDPDMSIITQQYQDLSLSLALLVEFASFMELSLDDLMKQAVHLRNRRNNDIGGVN